MIISDDDRRNQYADDLGKLLEQKKLHGLKVQRLRDELARLIEEGKPTQKMIDCLMTVIDGIFSAEDKEEILKKAGVATTATINKPAKVTKTRAARGHRTSKSPSVPIPDNLRKGTEVQMLIGKYSGQEGEVAAIAEKNGDRTFFIHFFGGKRTSVKAGTYGESWKIKD